jgi:hypothetical protein
MVLVSVEAQTFNLQDKYVVNSIKTIENSLQYCSDVNVPIQLDIRLDD